VPRQRSAIAALLADFERACAELGVGWYLFGAQAALLHGSPRATADVDLTVLLREHGTDRLAETLMRHGFVLRTSDPAFTRVTRVLPVQHASTHLPADVVLGGPGLEETFLARADHRKIEGVNVPVARAEDVVAMKILAARTKDEDDVLAILTAQLGRFDAELARTTLRALEQALAQDDLLPAFKRLLATAEGQTSKPRS
jgi:hypothetical protein